MTDDRTSGPKTGSDRVAALPKRFYAAAEAVEEDGQFRLKLDGRLARTPTRSPVAVPSRRIGEALAGEWNAQAERIDPARMPLTRMVNAAIDGVAAEMTSVRADILSYAGTDLLCYRADDPRGLVERQLAAWDPILEWAADRFGARLVLAAGVMHVAQPQASLDRLKAELDSVDDPFALTGLHVMTTLTGSALLALAVRHQRLDAAEAWSAAHVDEDWNMAQWGEDALALARRADRFDEMTAAALLAVDESNEPS